MQKLNTFITTAVHAVCTSLYNYNRGVPSKPSKPNPKKVVSDNLGLVDFAIGLVNSVLNLPDKQAKFF